MLIYRRFIISDQMLDHSLVAFWSSIWSEMINLWYINIHYKYLHDWLTCMTDCAKRWAQIFLKRKFGPVRHHLHSENILVRHIFTTSVNWTRKEKKQTFLAKNWCHGEPLGVTLSACDNRLHFSCEKCHPLRKKSLLMWQLFLILLSHFLAKKSLWFVNHSGVFF